ncbi:ABC transporter ATP-binding protein [Acidithiobacillus sp. IBUN Pt1247-S3]|uniref:ABC transporter ATP-binding protein n=1 Tax=Acidithiobacillus sp. IBUN Pt1247-S3 TaxID=3166642 RepID=UPI0034E41517
MSYIEVKNLSKHYHNETENIIFSNLSMSFAENRIIVVLGKSGAGKTTLLNLFAGFEKPSYGEINVAGETVLKPSPSRAVVFQQPTLFPWKSVRDNILTGLHHKSFAMARKLDIVMSALDEVDLRSSVNNYPHQLSGGMQQRVGIARALVMLPQLLLMDEPFSALDTSVRNSMQALVISLWKKYKLSILFITHSITEAVSISTDIVIIRKGASPVILQNSLPYPRNESDGAFVSLERHVSSLLAQQIDP